MAKKEPKKDAKNPTAVEPEDEATAMASAFQKAGVTSKTIDDLLKPEEVERMEKEPKKDAKNPTAVEPEDEATAMASAFQKAGVTSETIDDILKPEEVERTEKELDAIVNELKGSDLEGVRKLNEALRARAGEDSDTIAAAYRVRAYIERNIPNWEHSAFDAKHATAQRVIDFMKEKNPHAVVLNERRLETRKQERREAFVAGIREETKALRDQATASLHKACEGEEGAVAVRVTYDERGRDGKPTGKTRHGLILVEVRDGMGRIKAGAPERFLHFLVKYGTDKTGQPRWVMLDPEHDFDPESGARFPNIVREALVTKYASEEAYRERSARTRALLEKSTLRATQLVAGEKGFCSFHVPHWSARSTEGEIRGSLTPGFEGDGEGHITLKEHVTDTFKVENYVGESYSLPLDEGDVPTFLRRILKARIAYEARKAAEDKTPTDEVPEDEDAPTAGVAEAESTEETTETENES